jgi:hypothetical protein
MSHGGGSETLAHQQRGAEHPGLPRHADLLCLARQLAEGGITAAALEIPDEMSRVQSRTEKDGHGPHDLPPSR